MIKIIKVTGNSLSPEFQEGDFVVLVRLDGQILRNPFFFKSLKPGDILVFRHDEYGTMIKKFAHYEGDNDQLFVTGTHPHSVDSFRFGPISKKNLMGKVIWHIPRPRVN